MQRYMFSVLTLLTLPLLFVGSVTIQSNICENPTTPVIIAPVAGSVLSSQTTFVQGTATASSTVTVANNGQPAASVMSDVNGEFLVQLALAEGQNQLGVQVSNPCGISVVTSETVTVVLPPVVPVPPPVIPPASGGTGLPGMGGGNSGKTTPAVGGTSGQGAGLLPAPPTPTAPLRIRITAPADHLVTSKVSIFVSGTTNVPATERVMVNGTQVATLYNSTDTFGVRVPLNLGNNIIQVVGTANGKTTTTQVIVTRIRFAPLPEPWYDSIIAIAVMMLIIVLVGILLTRRRKKH